MGPRHGGRVRYELSAKDLIVAVGKALGLSPGDYIQIEIVSDGGDIQKLVVTTLDEPKPKPGRVYKTRNGRATLRAIAGCKGDEDPKDWIEDHDDDDGA
jgi:hypothetical protein